MLETPVNAAPLTKEQRVAGVNQQESQMSWLGGFIDGEGSFSITLKREKGKTFYYPDISIVNTNPLDIDKAMGILKPICGFHVETKQANGPRKLKLWRIRILGFGRVKAFLPAILPYLVGKREQAELLQQFVATKGDNDLDVREALRRQLSASRNPQRLYAQHFAHLIVK